MLHPWHDVPAMADVEADLCHAVIEIPKGGKIKYELDKPTGLLRVDRLLYSSVIYPANYGFIPRTWCDDGDPLDILVLSSEAIQPMAILRARPFGVMRMEDEGRSDDKILAVHADDPAMADLGSLEDMPAHLGRQIQRFFEDYKALEHKRVVVDEPEGAAKAEAILRQAIAMYEANAERLRAGLVKGA